jgi:putative copper export protein
MKTLWGPLYNLVLAFWVGGIAIFTFIVTPAIFRSYGRDMAGEIVGKLFPGYFLYNLFLAASGLALFFLVADTPARKIYWSSLLLLVCALIINAFIVFKLHPETIKAKQAIASFERISPDSPERRHFAKLHALSAVLNLVLFAEGVALLAASPLLRK